MFWLRLKGWLILGLMLFGVGIIIVGAIYGTGFQGVLAAFFGLGCIIASLGLSHG